jgi:hypothetical protein
LSAVREASKKLILTLNIVIDRESNTNLISKHYLFSFVYSNMKYNQHHT